MARTKTLRHHRGRRRAIVALLALGVLCGAEAVPAVPGHAQAALAGQLAVSDGGAALATAAPFLASKPAGGCGRLESAFQVGSGVFKGDHVGWYAAVWPSFQALDALSVSSMVPGGQHCALDFRRNLAAIDGVYWDRSLRRFPPAYDQGPRAFHVHSDLPRVDDSLWMGLALMWAYGQWGDPALLRRAETVFALARRNWASRTGGIYWEVHGPGATNQAKSVASAGPAVILGVQLYARTHDVAYLRWSERIYGWLRSTLFDPGTGLYADHVNDSTHPATIDRTTFTYNQGVMVGALVALSTEDPAAYPLSGAVRLAETAMAYFRQHRTYGQPAFDVIWAENAVVLAARYNHPAFTAQVRRSLELARRAAPPHPGDLLAASSEMAMSALARLPPGASRGLLFSP